MIYVVDKFDDYGVYLRELSVEVFLDLDIFNLLVNDKKKKSIERKAEVEEEEELEDNSLLFW